MYIIKALCTAEPCTYSIPSSPKKGKKAWVITRKEFPKKVTVPQSKPRKPKIRKQSQWQSQLQ